MFQRYNALGQKKVDESSRGRGLFARYHTDNPAGIQPPPKLKPYQKSEFHQMVRIAWNLGHLRPNNQQDRNRVYYNALLAAYMK